MSPSKIPDGCKEIDGELYCKPGLSYGKDGIALDLTSIGSKKTTMGFFLTPILVTAVLALVSLLSGYATTGDWQVSLGMAGYVLGIGFVSYGFLVPGFGIWMAVEWMGSITPYYMASFAVISNSWMEFVNIFFLVLGIIYQIIIILIIVFFVWLFASVHRD